jgi:hypothetical protein
MLGNLWRVICKKITPYAHIAVHHVPDLVREGVRLGTLDSTSIEVMHKKLHKAFANRTTNRRSVPGQLIKIMLASMAHDREREEKQKRKAKSLKHVNHKRRI